jgi:hypothetical protein
MTFVHFLGSQEIGLDFSKARFGIFRRKQCLNIFVQLFLIFFDRKYKITFFFHNLCRQPFLGVHGIASEHFS